MLICVYEGRKSPWSKLRPSAQTAPIPNGGSKNPFVSLESHDAATWSKKDKITYDYWINFESTLHKLNPEEEAYFVSDMLSSV